MDEKSESGSSAREKLDEFLGRLRSPTFFRRPVVVGALGVLLVVGLFLAYQFVGGSGDAAKYATGDLVRDDLRVTVSATGNLAPTNEVAVGSELSGIVSEVCVENNDRVTKGQVLARLDTARLQDAVNESEASLVSAKASVSEARATVVESRASLRRLQGVHRMTGGSAPSAASIDEARAKLTRAEAGLRVAQAAVGKAQAALSSTRTQMSKASIRSPVTGVVLSRDIDPGQTVAASLNAPVLFRIAEDLSKMQLEVKVDEADVGQVKPGQRGSFQVDAYPGRTFQAVVKRLDVGATTTATTSGGSGQVVAYTATLTAVNTDLSLRPGMTATVMIMVAEKKNVLLVPNAALRYVPTAEVAQSEGITSVLVPRRRRGTAKSPDMEIGRGSQQTLYILNDSGSLEPVSVQVGDSNGSQTEVIGEELKAGMKVVTGQLSAGAMAGK